MTYSEVYTCDFCGEISGEPVFNAWLQLQPMGIYLYDVKKDKQKSSPIKGELHFCSIDHLAFWIEREIELNKNCGQETVRLK